MDRTLRNARQTYLSLHSLGSSQTAQKANFQFTKN